MTTHQQLRDLCARRISRSVAADLLGIGHQKLARLIAEAGLDWPKQNQARRVVIDGIEGTFAEHAARLGVLPATLKSRYQRHGPALAPNRGLITPAKVDAFVEHRRAGVPAWRAAELVGHHYNWLHRKASQQHPEYRTIARHAKRQRRDFRIKDTV